jgi:hypothetical protein
MFNRFARTGCKLAIAGLATLALGACELNTAPQTPMVAAQPAPVYVQPAAPAPGTVVVQPRAY